MALVREALLSLWRWLESRYKLGFCLEARVLEDASVIVLEVVRVVLCRVLSDVGFAHTQKLWKDVLVGKMRAHKSLLVDEDWKFLFLIGSAIRVLGFLMISCSLNRWLVMRRW